MLREFGDDFNESRAPDRCRRRQATVLALCRSAHHHKCASISLTLMIQPSSHPVGSDDPSPSPGRAPDRLKPKGRLSHARLCSAPHDDTNASFHRESQYVLRRVPRVEAGGPPSKLGSPGAKVDRAFTRTVGPGAQWNYRRRRSPVFGRNAQNTGHRRGGGEGSIHPRRQFSPLARLESLSDRNAAVLV